MKKLKDAMKNISYTLSSNLLSLVVSIIVTLLLPKILGVEEYGYYQLYLFYVSYVGFLHFGWCDGIYLRYGGKNYQDLERKKMANQFYALILFQVIITLGFYVVMLAMNFETSQKELVVYFSILNILIMNVRTFIILVLQTTNRMKDYSLIIISDRIIFVCLIFLLMIMGNNRVENYIIADLIGKIISLYLGIRKTTEITSVANIKNFRLDLIEIKANVFSGINLMFANIAGSLIIGIIRFGIQDMWSIDVFGKVALSLSISNMLMIFINAISLAIFPIIKQTDVKKYKDIYPHIRTVLMPSIFTLLLLYYPISSILSVWLPSYRDSFRFMAIVFPIVVFEGKIGLITNTYLKAMRKEKAIFKVNLFTAILSLVITVVNIYILKDLFLTILSIPFLLAIKSVLSEVYLSKILNVRVYKALIIETVLVLVFILSGWNIQGLYGLCFYTMSLLVYLFFMKQDISNLLSIIKQK